MPDSKRFLHPEAIRKIGRLELRAKYIVEGFLAGMHRSPYLGQSVDFVQHREYTHGDDLRHVDWKVWARQDRLVVKQFEEETNLRCLMLVDLSASMSYGRGPLNKVEYARTAAASLAYMILHQQDAVGCCSFDEHLRGRVPIRSGHHHMHAILESLDAQAPREKTNLFPVLQEVAEAYPNRGIVVLISDLLGDRDGLFRGLKLLRQQGHDIIALHVMDDDELDFPFSGPTKFEGLELGDSLHCNPRALREGYLRELQLFLDEVRRECARIAVDYQLIRTSYPLDAALTALLTRRLHVHRQH